MRYVEFLKLTTVLNRSYSPGDVVPLPEDFIKRLVPLAAHIIEPDEEQLQKLAPSPVVSATETQTSDVTASESDGGNGGNGSDGETLGLELFDFLTDAQISNLTAAGFGSPGRILAALAANEDLTTITDVGKATVTKLRKALKLD